MSEHFPGNNEKAPPRPAEDLAERRRLKIAQEEMKTPQTGDEWDAAILGKEADKNAEAEAFFRDFKLVDGVSPLGGGLERGAGAMPREDASLKKSPEALPRRTWRDEAQEREESFEETEVLRTIAPQKATEKRVVEPERETIP